MAIYTELSLKRINELLIHYDIGVCENFTPLEDGSTNTNYVISTQYGQFVLTLFEELMNVDFLEEIHKNLKINEFPCAEIIQPKENFSVTINDKPVRIFSFLTGYSVDVAHTDHCELIGHYLAKLHAIDGSFVKKLTDTKGMNWAITKANELLGFSSISEDDKDIIFEELNYLKQFSQLSLPVGFIHADLFRDNAIFECKDDTISLRGIIDFEDASVGIQVFDLAIVINDWCSLEDGRLDRLKMRDIIAAYHTVRPLNALENQSIPLMLRAAAFRFWISRLYDGCKKDPVEFKNILLQRRSKLSGMQ